ncbi:MULTISPECIES: bifunctional phosphoribosyl-AMP cyclohydrolase/phosphoribosyl-ATP diphosphatase HisIE [Tepidibacillus]|uniref:Histidine biosynthesis bifunctional protein HisIE n=1 Tax=Tepidibacillus decaturensis TaxID=1413211 RepID=A0A135L6E9_9BACI|nr:MULTISPECIES: bifunctional phosphoribosyl-AMP cyclohydrolase/phosphoribosyl-ATP diphosphatase HisIE [Tepidibacillus]KXG44393.1 bifunctional phosphoribosyl-AMP cyclohydrolase/phosphoribosyl-ATP pyrophosphatase [Tepidibacillus decaturensis]GBF10627.1 phosphoribosyl-ATP pyrophosphatase [Tepidibacillus sp. HK-1]
MNQNDINTIKWNEKGLIPAVVQDNDSKQVLMVAYMNQESLTKTLETKETWFWSRSRQELWHKGATSGHIQKVKDIKLDCDQDTLLIFVEQVGVACHTGSYSCFGEKEEGESSNILEDLAELIARRDQERPEGSYTTYLFDQGIDKILKKVGEETSEVIIATKNENRQELIAEASDLLYHLLVLFQAKGIQLDEVMKELKQRHQGQNQDQKYERKPKL